MLPYSDLSTLICYQHPYLDILSFSQLNSDGHSYYSDSIDLSYKSQNVTVPYPTMLHSEQKCAHFCSECSIVGYGTGAFWDLWNVSFTDHQILTNFCTSHNISEQFYSSDKFPLSWKKPLVNWPLDQCHIGSWWKGESIARPGAHPTSEIRIKFSNPTKIHLFRIYFILLKPKWYFVPTKTAELFWYIKTSFVVGSVFFSKTRGIDSFVTEVVIQ